MYWMYEKRNSLIAITLVCGLVLMGSTCYLVYFVSSEPDPSPNVLYAILISFFGATVTSAMCAAGEIRYGKYKDNKFATYWKTVAAILSVLALCITMIGGVYFFSHFV